MIAWIGNLLLAICALPQAYKSLKDGNSEGISMLFLIAWTLGEYFTLIHVLIDTSSAALALNYITNSILCTIILYYKVYPRR